MAEFTQHDAQFLIDAEQRIILRRQEYAEQRDVLREVDPEAFLEKLLDLSCDVFTAFNFVEYYTKRYPDAFDEANREKLTTR